MKKQPLLNDSIMLYIRYQRKPKDSFIHSFIQLGQRCSYVGKLFEGFKWCYLYIPWYKPVVYDNFDEQM